MMEHVRVNGIDISTFSSAKKGNWCSGDSVLVEKGEDYVICAVADGLGSGVEAKESSDAVIQMIQENHQLDLEALMEKCNKALLSKRGAVLSVMKINQNEKEIQYCNVGNIGCIFYYPSGQLTRPIPSRGYLSGKKHNFKTQRVFLEGEMSFILHTDGLNYVPVYHSYFTTMNSPEVTLQQLVNNKIDQNDDTTILVGRVRL